MLDTGIEVGYQQPASMRTASTVTRRSLRRGSRDNLRAVSTPRSHSSSSFRLNPLWPEQPPRHYAIGPIEPGASGSTFFEPSATASDPSTPRRSAEELAGEVIEMQELELAEMVQQRQFARATRVGEGELERQRHQDWEREQYYIRLREEARRVTQMQHRQAQSLREQSQQLFPSSTSRSRGDRHQYDATPPSTDQQGWTQSHTQTSTSSSSSRESRDPQHKVYLLNCKHCGNFLSDRGMKAVLLLKPNITLYSTDAVPNQCGPYYTPTAFHGGADSLEPPIERTCNCLTQSLGCYGCGNQVGYSILSPCDQCTSSVQKHQRSSNGHRTVLHCSEISVRERRYVPGEPGVRAASYESVSCAVSSSSRTSRRHGSPRVHDYTHDGRDGGYPDFYDVDEEEADPEKTDAATQTSFYQQQHHSVHQHQSRSDRSRPSSRPSGGGKEQPRVMRRGDVVYWSDLVAGGERTQPFDPDSVLDVPAAGR